MAAESVIAELRNGMALAKCRACGCMQDALAGMQASLALPGMAAETGLAGQIEAWTAAMQPIRYACLGCEVCIAANAANLFAQTFPDASSGLALACTFEVNEGRWPIVPGEYLLFSGSSAPVAVSTLASLALPRQLADLRPDGLAIVGKTETENIGLDKIIKNMVANPALRYLIVAGQEAEGHCPGQTLLALAREGVDENRRVLGSRGKRAVLRNVTREEIETFRKQVRIVDMIGCEDAAAIAAEVGELAGENGDVCGDAGCSCRTQVHEAPPVVAALPLAPEAASCGCDGPCHDVAFLEASAARVIQAQAPANVELDRAGYLVIIVQRDRGVIVAEHYDYDHTLTGVIEGTDARSIYWTAIEKAWVSQLTHAAYLGKELARAELALTLVFDYVQDGA